MGNVYGLTLSVNTVLARLFIERRVPVGSDAAAKIEELVLALGRLGLAQEQDADEPRLNELQDQVRELHESLQSTLTSV